MSTGALHPFSPSVRIKYTNFFPVITGICHWSARCLFWIEHMQTVCVYLVTLGSTKHTIYHTQTSKSAYDQICNQLDKKCLWCQSLECHFLFVNYINRFTCIQRLHTVACYAILSGFISVDWGWGLPYVRLIPRGKIPSCTSALYEQGQNHAKIIFPKCVCMCEWV